MATTNKPAGTASQLDVVFDGTWVYAPGTDATGKIATVDIYSPACGHPHGVYFANELNPDPWPQSSSFYMLDPHSYILHIERAVGSPEAMDIKGIDLQINHILGKRRPIGLNWDLLVSIPIGPNTWVSSDTVDPHVVDARGNLVPCFSGRDAPASKVSSLQTLSFKGVNSVVLLGAPLAVEKLFPAPWSGNGTIVFADEVPYIPTLQHERAAIFAMANLAGLDLALDYPLPPRTPVAAPGTPHRQGLRSGSTCGHGIITIP